MSENRRIIRARALYLIHRANVVSHRVNPDAMNRAQARLLYERDRAWERFVRSQGCNAV